MDIKNKSLREAYALLENTTPLGKNDCGSVCDAYCCSDALGDSMELFPYEKEIFESQIRDACFRTLIEGGIEPLEE